MFDRLYKEANDDIPVNTELMEALMHKAAEKKKKKPFAYIYRYGFVAAAAAVIAVSLHAMPYINRNLIEDSSYIDAGNSTAESAEESSETFDKSAANAFESNQTYEEEAPSWTHPENTAASNKKKITDQTSAGNNSNPKTDTEASAIIQKTEPAQDAEEQESENASEETAAAGRVSGAKKADIQRSLAAGIDSSSEEQAYSGGETKDDKGNSVYAAIPDTTAETTEEVGTGGSASAAASSDAKAAGGVTLGYYCDYYGFDINNFAIPSGMSLVQGTEAYLGKNHVVIYEGRGKSLTITLVTEPTALTSRIEQADGERRGSNCLIVETGNARFDAYIVKNKRGIIINADRLEKEEIYSLVDSIR